MNALAVINAARTILAGTTYPAYLGDTLETDADGLVTLPADASAFVLDTITGTPEHQWGTTRFGTVRIQVSAFSRIEGQALAMLATASPLLAAATFIPLDITTLGRAGDLTGYAQDFERTT